MKTGVPMLNRWQSEEPQRGEGSALHNVPSRNLDEAALPLQRGHQPDLGSAYLVRGRKRSPWRPAWTLAALAGCAETVSGTGDGGLPDGRVDVVRAPCNEARIVDANAYGERVGQSTVVRIAPTQWTRGVTLPPSDGCGPNGGGDHQLLVRYVPRRGAFLTARLTQPTESPPRDTAVVGRLLLLDHCGLGARRLACVGRIESGEGLFPSPRTLTSPARVTAGEAVYLAASGDAVEATLQITEVGVQRGLGDVCDPLQHADRCPAGASCVWASPSECLPDGLEGAPCRRGATPCEPGLSCDYATREGFPGLCVRRLAPGAACMPTDRCLGDACGAEGRCPIPGARYGRCRTAAPRCDEGLQCVEGRRCAATIAPGERCSPRRAESVCAAGTSCVLVGDGWRCGRDGARDAACRAAAPRCDDGLVCGAQGTRCVPGLPTGGPGERCGDDVVRCAAGSRCVEGRCVPLGAVDAVCSEGDGPQCVAGASCVSVRREGVETLRCVTDGALHGACRAGGRPCDDGLSCGASARCLPAVAVGAACGVSAVCAGGERCEGTCRAAGAEQGWCRSSDPLCDAGLSCTPRPGSPPVCATTLAVGERCGSSSSREPSCPAGVDCRAVDATGGRRCTPRAGPSIVCTSDRGGPSVCPAGTACGGGLCRPLVGGALACNGQAHCDVGATCRSLASAPFSRCIADGAYGGRCRARGALCDPPLGCVRDARGDHYCAAGAAEGARCEDRWPDLCASGLSCVDGVCRLEGRRGALCRVSADACDAGLACDGLRCALAAPRGAACEAGDLCVAGLACVVEGASLPTCGDGPYAVSVRSDVPFEDPCELPVSEPSTPLTLRVFGVPHTVRVAPYGEAYLSAPPRAPGQVGLEVGGIEVMLDSLQADGVCARIVGEAPRRRLVFGGGRWRAGGIDEPSMLGWSATLHEGSDALEVRLRAPSPVAPLFRHVRVRLRAEGVGRFTSPSFARVPGTSVTLTPR